MSKPLSNQWVEYSFEWAMTRVMPAYKTCPKFHPYHVWLRSEQICVNESNDGQSLVKMIHHHFSSATPHMNEVRSFSKIHPCRVYLRSNNRNCAHFWCTKIVHFQYWYLLIGKSKDSIHKPMVRNLTIIVTMERELCRLHYVNFPQ